MHLLAETRIIKTVTMPFTVTIHGREEPTVYVVEQYHSLFSLDEREQGETNLVEFNIDTGESTPIKQVARRVPFAAQ